MKSQLHWKGSWWSTWWLWCVVFQRYRRPKEYSWRWLISGPKSRVISSWQPIEETSCSCHRQHGEGKLSLKSRRTLSRDRELREEGKRGARSNVVEISVVTLLWDETMMQWCRHYCRTKQKGLLLFCDYRVIIGTWVNTKDDNNEQISDFIIMLVQSYRIRCRWTHSSYILEKSWLS